MFRKLGLLGAVLALVSLAGGQWAVLQGVAWAEMLQQYTRTTGSFAVAVTQTFDGQHPCELCREIVAAKSQERPGSPAAPTAKKDALAKALLAGVDLPPVVRMPIGLLSPPSATPALPSRTEPPPTPPPRGGSLVA